MRRRTRGLTIVELMVAMTVLSVAGLLTMALFRMGVGGWKKMEAQSGLLADYEVLSGKLSREVQKSTYVSASTDIGPDGPTLAFLSATDDTTGVFHLDPVSYQPRWQSYQVFYYDSAARRIYLHKVPLAPGSPEIDSPEPIEDYDAGTGNIHDYRTAGRLLMADVDLCTFTLADNMLVLQVEGSRRRYGTERPETLKMRTSIAFRN